MKKLSLFVVMIALSSLSFAQASEVSECKKQNPLDLRAQIECLKNLAIDENDEKNNCVSEIKKIVKENPKLMDKVFKAWITDIVDAMGPKKNQSDDHNMAVDNELDFYLSVGGSLNYKYDGHQTHATGDTILHVAVRAVNGATYDLLTAYLDPILTMIRNADGCLKNGDQKKAFELFVPKTYIAGGRPIESGDSEKISKAFAAREKARKCGNSVVKK